MRALSQVCGFGNIVMKDVGGVVLRYLLVGSLFLFLAFHVTNVHAQPEISELEWVNQIISVWFASEPAIATDSSGNSIVVGTFNPSAIFDGATLTVQSGSDLFIAKYDPAGALLWARQAGGDSTAFATCKARGVATDSDGNILVTGFFTYPVTFGLGETNETTLSAIGGNRANDIFIAKFAPNGDLLWANKAGGTYHDEGYGIAADDNGNFFITGYVGGDVPDWGPIQVTFGESPNDITLEIEASRAIFVAKYGPDGGVIWAKEVDGYYSYDSGGIEQKYAGWDYGRGISVDGDGDCLVTGHFNYKAIFGPGEVNQITLGALENDKDHMFVAKFDGSDGTFLWANSPEAVDGDPNQGLGITTDGDGNSIVTGGFTGETNFGTDPGNPATLSCSQTDIFIAKYAPDGNLLWARQDGGDMVSAEGWSIASDGSDNILVTGYFSYNYGDPAVFGAGEEEEAVLASTGATDVFVAKYNPDGGLLWAKRDGGSRVDEGWSIASDLAGNILVAGTFYGTATFGAGEANEEDLTSGFQKDGFVMKLKSPNQPPEVTQITLPSEPVAIDAQPASIDAAFTDPDGPDDEPFICVVNFGDGTADEVGTISGFNCAASHTYATPGVYTVEVTVTDKHGASGSLTATDYIVIYDPSAGFVTGGGWFDSPEGAYVPDSMLSGRANFGFVSKYMKGKTIPDGNTEFQFRAADLNFHSSYYEWLIIAGAKAMFKGAGTINGEGNYGFMLSAIDAALTPSTDSDLFRIRIWEWDTGDLVYDNKVESSDPDADPDTTLGGGNISIHKK